MRIKQVLLQGTSLVLQDLGETPLGEAVVNEISIPIEDALELLDCLQTYKEDLIRRLQSPENESYDWKVRLLATYLHFVDIGTSKAHIQEEGQKTLMLCGERYRVSRIIQERMMDSDDVCSHCTKRRFGSGEKRNGEKYLFKVYNAMLFEKESSSEKQP